MRMQISTSGNQERAKKNSEGFSLLEILVALTLIGFTSFAVISSMGRPGRELEEMASNLERIHRFALDEAIFRNRVVRLRFFLDRHPQEYAVEYGPNADFVVPSVAFSSEEPLGLQERESFERGREEMNQHFYRVTEFSEKNREVPQNITLAVGTNLSQVLMTEGEASIFFYPDGERDASFITLGDGERLSVITAEPFMEEVEISSEAVPQDDSGPFEAQTAMAQELFEKWIKN